jgi:hypothetical protein
MNLKNILKVNHQPNRPMDLTHIKSALAALILAIACPAWGQSDDLPYVSGSTGADGALNVPATFRELYAFATTHYPGKHTVLFGGRYSYNGNIFNTDTWTFDGSEWTALNTDTFVSGRINTELVYDPVNDVVVLFGGLRADNVRLNDTWIWDGTDWTLANPATKPPARDFHEMVWDSVNDRVLLFGGESGAADLVDLWEWDGTDWAEIVLTNDISSARSSQSYYEAVFEESTGRIILYSENYRQTWALDLTTATWAQISTTGLPNVGQGPRMVYDGTRDQIILAGGSSNTQTWIFENDDWVLQSPATSFPYSYDYGLSYNSDDGKVYRYYGYASNQNYQETYSWDGTTWSFVVGRVHEIDMADKPDGIWNYTSINVPTNVEVAFKKNAANSPVIWLASGFVQIDGIVRLNGRDSTTNDQSGSVAIGGPGGFDGGLGGVRFDVSGSYVGTPGQGPGGGDAPTDPDLDGGPGTYDGTYGNRLIQPLIGGSGGGGASATDSQSGGNGGGGGGAILIASSRDVTINGILQANGGLARTTAPVSNGEYGGGGSGGAIRLIADRILGTGSIQANGGDSYGAGADGGPGRIRIEAFYRPIVPNASPVPSATAPTETDELTTSRRLWIANVAGEAVGANPTGSLLSPDVVFTQTGSITITVNSENIPVGTPVLLRITTVEGVINLPDDGQADVTLNGSGVASFSTTVPAGLGTVQATAEFTIGGN